MSNYFLNESFTFIAIPSMPAAENITDIIDNLAVNGSTDGAGNNRTSDDINSTLSTAISLTIIYLVIFISGILGNVITCVVISQNKSMHTATNYYLFSLAVSDLLVLIAGLPFEMYNLWNGPDHYPFDTTMCILQSSINELSANASVLTITAFTIERYVAICKPFLSHTMSKLSRAVKLVLVIWALSVLLAVLPAREMGVVQYAGTNCTYCTVVDAESAQKTFTISVILVFILPMLLISVLYIAIGLQLRRSKIVNRGGPAASSVRLKHRVFKKPTQRTIVQVDVQNDLTLPFTENHRGDSQYSMSVAIHHHPSLRLSSHQSAGSTNSTTMTTLSGTGRNKNMISHTSDAMMSPEDGRINFPSNKSQNHATRHVVNMLVAVVVAFFICWGFYHAQRLFAIYVSANNQQNSPWVKKIYHFLTNVSGIFYYFSTCVNPFLYNIMSHKFRNAFKATIDKCVSHKGEHHMPFNRAYLCRSSNSFRSQSLNNTCSSIVSTAGPHHNHRYPVIVSFRKVPRNPTPPSSSDQMRPRTRTMDADYCRPALGFCDGPSVMECESDSDSLVVPRLSLHQPFFRQKRVHNSPYDSPEMTQDSIRFEQNLNRILQELAFKSYVSTNDRKSSISKSRSVPSFFENR